MSPAKKLDEYIKLIRRDVAERIKIHHSNVLAGNMVEGNMNWASDDAGKQARPHGRRQKIRARN